MAGFKYVPPELRDKEPDTTVPTPEPKPAPQAQGGGFRYTPPELRGNTSEPQAAPSRPAMDSRGASIMSHARSYGEKGGNDWDLEGKEDFNDLSLRADLSMSDTFEEKRQKFRDAFPEGDLFERDGKLYGTKGPDQTPSPIDREGFESGDVADWFDTALTIGAEGALAVGSRGTSLLRHAGKMGGVAAAVEGGKEYLETVRGYQQESKDDILKDMAAEGALGAAGTYAGEGVAKLFDLKQGAGLIGKSFKDHTDVAQINEFAAQHGLDALMPYQTINSKLVRRIGNAARQLGGAIDDQFILQHEKAIQLMKSLNAHGFNEGMWEGVKNSMKKIRQTYIRGLENPKLRKVDGGRALTDLATYWERSSQEVVSEAYRAAENIAAPEFDLSRIKSTAEDILFGTQSVMADGAQSRVVDPDGRVADIALRLGNLNDNLEPITRPDGSVDTPIQQLRRLRTELYDLAYPADGNGDKAAKRLYGALTETLENPRNASPEFTRAWQEANRLARERFTTKDMAWMKELLSFDRGQKLEDVSVLVDRMMKPNNTEALGMMARMSREADTVARQNGERPPQYFERFKSGAFMEVLRRAEQGEDIGKFLSEFDNETLGLIFDRNRKEQLVNLSTAMEKLNTPAVEAALKRQSQDEALARDLIDTDSTATIAALRQAAEADPKLKQNLKIAVLNAIATPAITRGPEGERYLNPKIMSTQLERFTNSGALDAFAADVKPVVEGLVEYLNRASYGVKDSGASLVAADLSMDVVRLDRQAIQLAAAYRVLGHILASPRLGAKLFGEGGKPVNHSPFWTIGSMSLAAAQELAEEGANLHDDETERLLREYGGPSIK